jgi:hypothetical protein
MVGLLSAPAGFYCFGQKQGGRLMGSLIDALQRREAAARAEAEELRGRIAELAERLAGVEERLSRLVTLPACRPSHALARLAAVEAARGSFEAAHAAVTRRCGPVIGKRRVEQAVVSAAADIAAFYAALVLFARADRSCSSGVTAVPFRWSRCS